MAQALLLEQLEIQGFRAFESLRIDKLGRLNLFVGKNGAGKSCVLEALRLYGTGASFDVVRELVATRREGNEARAILSFFHDANTPSVLIGANGRNLEISVEPGGLRMTMRMSGYSAQIPLGGDLTDPTLARVTTALPPPCESCVYVGPNGIDAAVMSRLWELTALTPAEDRVVESLQLIATEIVRVSLVEGTPRARVTGSERPVPLARLGDGLNRLFGMSLALVNSKNGLLLVDEIENGIHYSIQEQLWRFMLYTAQRYNVQVFATTHSWDCVKAFQAALAEHPEEGMLTRLQRRQGAIVATQFDEADLHIATQENIEVR